MMRKFLAFIMLTLLCVSGWADTQVIARMSDLVGAATHNDATVSTQWKASKGVVYEFGNNTYIGGITNEAVKSALGSKFVTVAAWVYGRPSGCIFGYGDNGTGIKFMLNSTTFKTTTKSKADYQTASDNNIAANQWNLVAFTINTAFNETRYVSGHQGDFGYYFTKGRNGGSDGMNTPEEAGQLFAIGSGDQGVAREAFTGLIANVTVIASDAYLTNADKVADLVGAAPSPKAVVEASNLDDLHNAKWYNLTVRGKYITYNASQNRYKTSTTQPTDNTGLFAFVGDNSNGYKILNYAAGANVAMGAANVTTNTPLEAKPLDEAQSFVFENVTYDNQPAWQIRQKDNDNAFLNDGDSGHGNNLIYWNANARGDYGNVFTFEEIEDEAYYYVTYKVTATRVAADPITWVDNKFVSTTQTTPSYNPSYSYFSDYTIINTQNKTLDQKRDFQVTAQHTLPMVPGKFYQIKQGTTYLQRQSESVVSLKAANDQTNPANLWYIKTAPHAPYFYLYNVESEKAVNALNNSAAACTEGEVADPLNYLGTIYSIEFKKIGDNFQMFKSGTTQNLGSHGTLGSTANHALGLWNNGDTQFSSEIFDLVFPTQEFANYVGGYASSPSYYTALEDYNSDNTSAANLKAVLAEYNTLETIVFTPNKYYRLRNVGSIGEEGSNRHLYSWLTSTLGEKDHMVMSHAETPDASAIFYYDGESLRAYNNGKYASGETTSDEAYAWEVEKFADEPIASYMFKNGSNYLTYWGYDSNNNYPGALMKNRRENWAAWYLQEVPMYTVTINDADAYVQTADEVQIKNGGKLYVATAETAVTASDKDGYRVDVVKNDADKTITVTYTEEAPVELTSGYYYIKNKASNKYLVNNYDFTTTTTLSGSKVTTNNGVWKVDVNDNNTITLKNGISTPLYVGGESVAKLTYEGTALASGVYFTEKIDGSGVALTIGAGDAPATTWVFEPIAETDKIIDVIVNGDNGQGVVSYNAQKATNGGFFRYDADAVIVVDNYSLSEVDGKESSKICRTHKEPYYVDAEYFVFNETAKNELQKLIDEIVSNVEKNEIGYPKKNSIIYDSQATSEVYGEILYSYNDKNLLANGDKDKFITLLIDARTIANFADINLPTPGGFYTLTNSKGVTKTYYFKEGNGGLSQLLCYGDKDNNGQFAEISEDFTSVAFKEIGEISGEEFAFMAARTNEKGMPVNLGKVCVWQSGEGPLPSEDENFYSGWTITKQPAPAIKMNSVDATNYYTTLYMPEPVIMPEGVTAYSATVSGDKFILHEVATAGETLAAYTPVILSGAQGTKITVATSDEGAKSAEFNDLKGTITTMPQAEGTTYYVLSGEGGKIGFYKYNKKSTNNLNGFKVYYDGTAGSGNSNNFEFVIGGDDDLTGIENATVDSANAPIRDLNGNIITNPIKGQIYIQNGKAIKY